MLSAARRCRLGLDRASPLVESSSSPRHPCSLFVSAVVPSPFLGFGQLGKYWSSVPDFCGRCLAAELLFYHSKRAWAICPAGFFNGTLSGRSDPQLGTDRWCADRCIWTRWGFLDQAGRDPGYVSFRRPPISTELSKAHHTMVVWPTLFGKGKGLGPNPE